MRHRAADAVAFDGTLKPPALDPDHFAVADDERNTLMIYKRQQAEPVAMVVTITP